MNTVWSLHSFKKNRQIRTRINCNIIYFFYKLPLGDFHFALEEYKWGIKSWSKETFSNKKNILYRLSRTLIFKFLEIPNAFYIKSPLI